jgi:hypothetical protein
MNAAAGTAFASVLLAVTLAAPLLLPVHLSMTADEDGIRIEPRGFDLVWTMRRRITIPTGEITSIRVLPRAQLPTTGVRPPGASLPGIITVGSYGTGEDRVFWDVRRGTELLVVYCRAGSPYRAYVLEFPDPHAVMGRLQSTLER